ncbi:urea ABC transporter substrate-binding protein [Pacificimonas flava]|uniref:Urea ABC transporter substrate-binding protein n=2 Tax=Pacificimonas TaxID=1960290 RepID=A0A219B1B8_9SPHN|nr:MULTISPECIES: urea ABC transporter substrate-binding protein [Pacificimonas]MBZ6379613.1 urea ABC transporter substrate-binding protein [Pacificimonas aurantium]OWV31916.1 urea ABC transporter substrate-binding protein [Pacificimonas flava]
MAFRFRQKFKRSSAVWTAAALLAISACSGGEESETAAISEDAVKVGILQSLTGTMAISEITVKNATELAIEQINDNGGVLGREIVAVVEDGASEPATFAQKAQKLIEDEEVATVFGGWTSASRKAMLPVFERTQNLLWYPVQFEGNECSPNIMYSGAQPNQQILPALGWAEEEGYESYFLVGSDYVFPRTANLILKKHLEDRGLELAGEAYVPLGGTDFSGVISRIRSADPDIIFNTLNGDSNVAFFKQMQAAGMPPSELPVMSFSIGEQEAQAMGTELVEGSYATWNYFQSMPDEANQSFVGAYQEAYGEDAAITDPMVHGYLNVYAWKAAVEKAGSFDPAEVREAARDLGGIPTPMGEVNFAPNGSLVQTAYVGKLGSDGQFEIVSDSGTPIDPQPYDPLAFPDQSCEV